MYLKESIYLNIILKTAQMNESKLSSLDEFKEAEYTRHEKQLSGKKKLRFKPYNVTPAKKKRKR